jgi:hypothetical protein
MQMTRLDRQSRTALSFALAGLLLVAPQLATAQTGVYHAPPDTTFLITYNPHRLYWVRGGDTLGGTNPALTVSSQRWRSSGRGFLVTTHQVDLDLSRRVRDDTLRVDSSGHVAIPVGSAGSHAVDFTIHFPSGAPHLTPGFTWSDTTQTATAGGSGPLATRDYRVSRQLRIVRVLDTLGTQVVEISGDGLVHYADAWWVDSVARSYAWMDVTGPTHEMYWFDARASRLMARRWSMSLHGQGGIPTTNGTDTVPAGLVASESERVITAAIAHALGRNLGGPDTTLTFATENGTPTGQIFVQTERFDSSAEEIHVESGFARADGMIATVRAAYRDGQARAYDAIWTDSTARPVHHRFAIQGHSIVLHEDLSLDTLTRPTIDTTIAAPAGSWAIAEYAMDELLVPVARTLARDTILHTVSVFRPTPRRWDTVRMRVKAVTSDRRPALVVYSFSTGASKPTVLIISQDGTLLYTEDARAHGSRRLPQQGSSRYAELEAIIKLLRAGSPTSGS